MRNLLLAATALLLPQASVAEPAGGSAPQLSIPIDTARVESGAECRKTTSYQADSELTWKDKKLAPKKLTELPDATAYMAVYRSVDGCEVPMTVVEYRSGNRP